LGVGPGHIEVISRDQVLDMNDHFSHWTPLREKKKLPSYATHRRLVSTRLLSCSANQLIAVDAPWRQLISGRSLPARGGKCRFGEDSSELHVFNISWARLILARRHRTNRDKCDVEGVDVKEKSLMTSLQLTHL